jgi:hypothetical protein
MAEAPHAPGGAAKQNVTVKGLDFQTWIEIQMGLPEELVAVGAK